MLLADKLREPGLYDKVPAEAWDMKWVVDLKPIGDGTATLKYLAPYVYRVAVGNNRIEHCDDVVPSTATLRRHGVKTPHASSDQFSTTSFRARRILLSGGTFRPKKTVRSSAESHDWRHDRPATKDRQSGKSPIEMYRESYSSRVLTDPTPTQNPIAKPEKVA